uniref:Uncharacterized protein n=1 Tax=Amphimedon queenslandica TaxID=400682 RepID=A0A1X7VFP4_AMPQE
NITSKNALSSQESTVELLKSNYEYCNETEVSSCVLPSVKPTLSSTLISSSSIYSLSSFVISSLPLSPSFLSIPSSSSPTQREDDGSILISQVSLALGSIVTLIVIFAVILCAYCLYRNKASIKLVTTQSFNKTKNIGDITNDANPCYGVNITSTGNDIVVYDELNNISDSRHMITTTEANPCYGPDPPHAIKAKLHTYGNVANNNSKWNEYGPIYEDTDTFKIALANVCSRSLPSPNITGGAFSGGVQLLIPSWTFSCQGVIDDWFAHVFGNTSVTVGSGIEYQILKPDPVKSNVYSLVYGNMYGGGGESATGSRIEIDVVASPNQALLPVRPGYIVGVYIDSNAFNQLSLIYDNTAEDIDIYYWENLTGRMCDLSLCDAKVMRGVRPLIGWIFINITSMGILFSQEATIELLRSNNYEYCNETEVSSCVLPSVEPPLSSTLISSSSIYRNKASIKLVTPQSFNKTNNIGDITNDANPCYGMNNISTTLNSLSGGLFTGGVQLLIPSWTFSCQGVIDDWFALVIGNTSVTVGSGIEFQVLKPDPVKSNVYSLVYGNTYGDGGESATGSTIEINVVASSNQALLPVRPGYIVGVYIDSNAVNQLSLLYEDTAEDIDIYYWENLTGRMCNLSLCDAKVMRGVRPLIGWIF